MLYEPILKENLDRLLRAYTAGTGLAASTVGKRFTEDSRFFDRILHQGCSFTVAKYDLVVSRFVLDWPKGVDWPPGVHKPSLKSANAVVAANPKKSRAA